MGFFKKIKKIALPVIGAAIGAEFGMPQLGAALGSGVSSYTSNHDLGSALAAGAGSYLGSSIGGSIGDSLGLGSVGDFSSAAGLGNAFGLEGTIGSSLANTGIGSILGGAYGSGNFSSDSTPKPQISGIAGAQGPTPFQPSQESAQDRPLSLAGLGGLDPQQQATNLATQGTYGGGLGPQEQSYFLNMENRKLVDQSGQTQAQNTLSPIEQSYLQKLGFGGYGDSNSLLEAISKWRTNQAQAA